RKLEFVFSSDAPGDKCVDAGHQRRFACIAPAFRGSTSMGSTLKWAGSHFTVESILSCAGSTVNYGDETLSVFDIKTRRPIATLSVGTHHQGLAVDSKSNLMYVANVHGDSTTVIDGAVNIVLGVRNAGKH